MEPPRPPLSIVYIMCSLKDKKIAELKEKGDVAADRLHSLREEKKGAQAYIDELIADLDAQWTRASMEIMDAKGMMRMEKLEFIVTEFYFSILFVHLASIISILVSIFTRTSIEINDAKQSEYKDFNCLKNLFTATHRFDCIMMYFHR